MAHWNYRVIEYTDDDGEVIQSIHSVHYRDDVPEFYSEMPVEMWSCDGVGGDVCGLAWMLDKMREALEKPVLRLEDFQG